MTEDKPLIAMIRGNKCNKFSNVAYVLFLCVLYAYVTYYSINRYKNFKRAMFDPRFGQLVNEVGMNFYLSMIILGLAFFPVIIYTALLKTGNYSSDGECLGKTADNVAILRENRGFSSQEDVLLSPWKRLEKRCLPVGHMCHVISAFCFYLPIPVAHAELIGRTGANREEVNQRILESDFSFLFSVSDKPKMQSDNWIEQLSVSPEFFNIICALIYLTVTYPGVFWQTNKLFTFLFSLLMLIASCYSIVDISVASILHKAAYLKSFLSENDLASVSTPYLPANFALGLSIFGSLTILFLFSLMFEYGFSHYQTALEKATFTEKNGSSQKFSRQNSTTSSVNSANRKQSSGRFCLSLSALGLVTIPSFLKATIVFECHQSSHQAIMVVNLVLAYLYLSLWLIIWIIYLFKTEWIFEVEAVSLPDPFYMTTGSFNNNSTLLGRSTYANGRIDTFQSSTGGSMARERYESTSSNPIYPSVFPEENGSGSVRMGSPRVHSPDNYSEDTDNSSRTASNYVLLQNDMPPAMLPIMTSSAVFMPLHEDLEEDKDRSSQNSFDLPQSDADNHDSPDRPTTGLLKYTVTRNSFRNGHQQLASVSSSDLEDNSPLTGTNSLNSRFRKSNRVTFKESPAAILESPHKPSSPTSDNEIYIDMKRKRSSSVGEVMFLQNHSPGRTPADNHTYYNQSEFAAMSHDQASSYLRQHSAPSNEAHKQSLVGNQSLNQVHLPLRSPFNSLSRGGVKEVAPPQDPRLWSRV